MMVGVPLQDGFGDGVSQQDVSEVAEHPGALCLSGDFYIPTDNVTRGVTMETFAADTFAAEGWPCCGEQQVPLCSQTTKGTCGSIGRSSEERFQSIDAAVELPEDVDLVVTTIYVQDISATDAGNSALDFFDSEESTSVTKMRRAKFSIKVTARVGGLSCEMKVYIYATGSQGVAMEFQRRTGDAVAFADVYRRASKYMATRSSNFANVQ